MTQPSEYVCYHERLNQQGRCVECNEWAVLTGQVPVREKAQPVSGNGTVQR